MNAFKVIQKQPDFLVAKVVFQFKSSKNTLNNLSRGQHARLYINL